jgi:hypothetical protein
MMEIDVNGDEGPGMNVVKTSSVERIDGTQAMDSESLTRLVINKLSSPLWLLYSTTPIPQWINIHLVTHQKKNTINNFWEFNFQRTFACEQIQG